MGEDRRWNDALVEHDTVVDQFLAACQRVEPNHWHRESAAGKWSVAAVALHVCRAYELARDFGTNGRGMRMRVSPQVAWLSRTFFLPLVFATKRFPSGARAPSEVVPDAAEARLLMPGDAAARLKRAAGEGAAALRRAADERPVPRLTHAYFGALTPYSTLRLLSAHTRHHARGLGRVLQPAARAQAATRTR